jgi:hypothetical protein
MVLLGIAGLIALLAGTMTLANRSNRLAPDFLSEFVLYSLSVADLTMLVALVFVLARSVIKLLVERRRALPFAASSSRTTSTAGLPPKWTRHCPRRSASPATTTASVSGR